MYSFLYEKDKIDISNITVRLFFYNFIKIWITFFDHFVFGLANFFVGYFRVSGDFKHTFRFRVRYTNPTLLQDSNSNTKINLQGILFSCTKSHHKINGVASICCIKNIYASIYS